jgi:peptide/nickel transport system substrate-binding protein
MKRPDIDLIKNDIAHGRLGRREAIVRLIALGLSAAESGALLSAIDSKPATAAQPQRRGVDGSLKILYWQAPNMLNAHLAEGNQDLQASRLCTEPLLTVDGAGRFTPVLAAEVPTRANGGLAPDGASVTYRLKRGIRWADGQPFTSDDVVFTYQFISDKHTKSTWFSTYSSVDRVEALDPYTVKVTYQKPTPAWYQAFVGDRGQILPRHALEAYLNESARNAPFNTKCFGTGPYKVDSFAPGDLIVYSINEYYREPLKPAFKQVQFKGGGDAVSAARAVLQTGDYDYAFNLQVEWPVLDALTKAGRGKLATAPGSALEGVYFNMTDPNTERDGQRSALGVPHPFLSDVQVRRALAFAIDRLSIASQLYGEEGAASANILTTPTRYASKNTRIVFDPGQANQLLDAAGWRRGPDGIRMKNGVKMQLTLATSTNTLRQKEQQIIKAGWDQIGASTQLKAIDSGSFFSISAGNNDTYLHFYNDAELYANNFTLFPSGFMAQYYSGDPARTIAQKENGWAGQNVVRWQSAEFNRLYDEALVELDPQKNANLWIRMNDLLVDQVVEVPLIDRKIVAARAATLYTGNNMSPFDPSTPNVAEWRRVSS